MTTVTLIGARLAEEGTEFVYHGEAEGCADCPYRDQCLNLTTGRRYRITEVRESGQTLDCAVHDTGVRAVEVAPAPVTANVPTKGAYAGSKASLAGPCPHTDCPSHAYCEPMGGEFETEYRIADIVGEPPHDYCYLDRELTMVEFEPPEDA